MGKHIDLTGQKFGDWTVVERVSNDKHNNARYLCRCVCGKENEVNAHSLTSGKSLSCGCNRTKDLTGRRFGKLLVIKRVENNKFNKTQYLCRCDCGRETVKLASLLLSGKTTSCGKQELEGKRFGRLLAIKEVEPIINDGHKYRAYLCKCDCGTEKVVKAKQLIRGNTVSCGCYAKEMARKRGAELSLKYQNIPNKCQSRLYTLWRGIKKRCNNENDPNFHNYGGRGITVCDEWRNDFQAFYDWAMESGYKEEILPNGNNKWTIDRIDVNGNYEPSNCRWVDMKVQSNNTRTNHLLEFKGETKNITEWSKEVGLPAYLIVQRINRLGWTVEKALTTPKPIKRK